MKKIFALVIAIALTLALAVPALADGEDAAVFGTELNLVANDPTVEYDEWDVPYNVWNVIPADTKLNVGDTVTLALSYTVPAAVEGYSERMLSSIEYLTSVEGIDGLTLVEAQGCPGKMQCDYEHGYCMPIPGEYSNVAVEGNVCTVMAELDSFAARLPLKRLSAALPSRSASIASPLSFPSVPLTRVRLTVFPHTTCTVQTLISFRSVQLRFVLMKPAAMRSLQG